MILNKVYDCIIYGAMSVHVMSRFLKSDKNDLMKKYVQQRLGNIKIPVQKNKNIYWIHSVSVGEIGAAALVGADIKKRDKSAHIIATVFTTTGYTEAKRHKDSIDEIYFCPIDTSALMNKFINKIKPKALIIIDGDFWMNMILSAAKKQIPVFVVNAKLSKVSSRRYYKLRNLTKPMFDSFTKVYAQTKLYAERFKLQGVEKSKIQLSGNVKVSINPKQINDTDLNIFKKEIGLDKAKTIVSFNSIHPLEIETISKTIQLLKKEFADIAILITPRHPVKYNNSKDLKDEFLINNTSFVSSNETELKNNKIVWLNKMGIMPYVYKSSKLAFIGGTFDKKIGGHNIIESCFYDVPSLFGPFTQTQAALVEITKQFKTGILAKSDKDLFKKISNLLKDKKLYNEYLNDISKMKDTVSKTCSNIVDDILKQLKNG